MGLLDQVIGAAVGSRFGGGGGRSSPIVMALMALLASRAVGGASGAGGLGGMLGGMLGGNQGAGHQQGGGGLGGILGNVLGGGQGQAGRQSGGLGGGLGGMLGGAAAGGGLGALIDAFGRSGHGNVAQSWVSPGQNHPLQPHQLSEALGDDTVEELARQTGLPREDLLNQLSDTLPEVVDKLTPEGRLPEPHEYERW